MLAINNVLTGCGKKTSTESEVSESAPVEIITLLNTKSEVATQMETLASKYIQETGITVEVMGVDAGADVQAMIKGYYLSDQIMQEMVESVRMITESIKESSIAITSSAESSSEIVGGIKKISEAINENNEITEQLNDTTQKFKSL